jgi:hypothetical protein
MSLSDTLVAVPDQVLDAISTAQDLVVSTVQAMTETTKPLTDRLPEPPFAAQLPSPVVLVEVAYATAEKFLANQKEFSVKLLEAYLPAPRTTKPAAKRTKAAAA